MRSVRSTLVGLGTLTILLTFVGFATFSPNGSASRPDTTADPTLTIMAAEAGATTGRVTAFVFANQLQGQIEPEIQTELTTALLVDQGRRPVSVPNSTQPTTTTTTARPTVTTTTRPPATTTTTTTTTPADTTTTTTTTPATTTTTTTTPATTTTTMPAGGRLSESEMRALASQYFPAEEVDKAVLVARCESNLDPSAYNPSGPYGGLYQHSLAHWDARAASAGWAGASIYDPVANTAVTAWLFDRGGWGHWPWCSAWADAQLGG